MHVMTSPHLYAQGADKPEVHQAMEAAAGPTTFNKTTVSMEDMCR